MSKINKCLLVFGAIFVFTLALNSYKALCKPRTNTLVRGKSNLKNPLKQENLPFKLKERFTYKVRFNGIYMGKIECEYSGQKKLDDKLLDTINLTSDVKILRLLEIQSQEKLFIDSHTHLPYEIERKVKFFGKQEKILEEYNQKENYVKITTSSAKETKEELIHLQAPVHNVIALLYLFPKDLRLRLGESFSFALPTQKINIKVVAMEIITTSKGSYEAYVLRGQPRKFKIWLEKERRIPLKMEFPLLLGKITISLVD